MPGCFWLYKVLSLTLDGCLSFSGLGGPALGWAHPEHPQVPSSCSHIVHNREEAPNPEMCQESCLVRTLRTMDWHSLALYALYPQRDLISYDNQC